MAKSIPLVFACSGCSNAGQLANQLAIELDRRGIAEMSCLAGIGAGKRHFLNQLQKREVWVIDGCPIECALGNFASIRHVIDVHLRLYDFGVKKNIPSLDEHELEILVEKLMQHARQSARTHDIEPETSDEKSAN